MTFWASIHPSKDPQFRIVWIKITFALLTQEQNPWFGLFVYIRSGWESASIYDHLSKWFHRKRNCTVCLKSEHVPSAQLRKRVMLGQSVTLVFVFYSSSLYYLSAVSLPGLSTCQDCLFCFTAWWQRCKVAMWQRLFPSDTSVVHHLTFVNQKHHMLVLDHVFSKQTFYHYHLWINFTRSKSPLQFKMTLWWCEIPSTYPDIL